MADNVAITAGSGTTIAAEDVSSVFYQRVKLRLGGGTPTDAIGGAGAVGDGVQRVTLASDDPAVTALEIIDDIVKAEDAGHSSGDKGVMALAVYRAAKTLSPGTDADYTPLAVNSAGDLRVDAGDRFLIRTTPTVTAGAYTAEDSFGGEQTLTNAARFSGGGGSIKRVSMMVEDDDADGFAANDIEVLFFQSDPGGTYTDNATIAGTGVIDADAALIVGHVKLSTKVDLGNVTMLYADCDIPYVCSGSANLFAVAIARVGVTPEATDAVNFLYHLERD